MSAFFSSIKTIVDNYNHGIGTIQGNTIKSAPLDLFTPNKRFEPIFSLSLECFGCCFASRTTKFYLPINENPAKFRPKIVERSAKFAQTHTHYTQFDTRIRPFELVFLAVNSFSWLDDKQNPKTNSQIILDILPSIVVHLKAFAIGVEPRPQHN